MGDESAGRGLAGAVKGELRAGLEALRDALADEIDNGVRCKACGGVVSSPTAPLAKQLRDVLTQLAAMKKPGVTKTDDLKAKRDARRAGVADRPRGGQQRRGGGDRTSG